MNEEAIEMKVLYFDAEGEFLTWQVFVAQATIAQVAAAIRNTGSVGIGGKYFAFVNANVPAAIELNPAWDNTDAAVCSAEVSVNEAAISAMLNDAELQALPNDKVWEA